MSRSIVALTLIVSLGACNGEVLTGPEAEVAVRRAAPIVGETEFPLILVNGVEMEARAVRQIPSTSIESVEVVKGLAAVRTYGDRAARGVIIIKLKPAATAR